MTLENVSKMKQCRKYASDIFGVFCSLDEKSTRRHSSEGKAKIDHFLWYFVFKVRWLENHKSLLTSKLRHLVALTLLKSDFHASSESWYVVSYLKHPSGFRIKFRNDMHCLVIYDSYYEILLKYTETPIESTADLKHFYL